MYPSPQHPGYRPPPSSGISTLTIVLIVLGVIFVIGGGGCLLCVGLAASTIEDNERSRSVEPAATAAPIPAPTEPAVQPPTPVAPLAPAPPKAPKAATGPRIVDFVCPPGKAPGGVVRAGCMCGNEILGTACGAPGNFTDVVETPRGCRFTCN